MKCTACNATSREALVSWGDDAPTYRGRINDSFTWNGWLVPAFTRSEVEKIAKDSEGVEGLCQISELGDGFQIASHDAAPDSSAGWSEVVEPTECCGLFFVGDWWTWAEVEPELGDLPQYTSAHLTEI